MMAFSMKINNHVNYIGIFILATLGLCFLNNSYAEVPRWSSQNFKSTHGIIGEVDIIHLNSNDIPNDVKELRKSIGVFYTHLPHQDNLEKSMRRVSQGVGTLSCDYALKCSIFTAAHLIYDTKTLLRNSDMATFALPGPEVFEVDLTQLPKKLKKFDFSEDIGNDIIRVPVEIEGIKPFPSGMIGKSRASLDVDPMVKNDLFSISLLKVNKRFFYTYQDNFLIEYSDYVKYPAVNSDMDTVEGMSGSPVFFKDKKGKVYLIGIVVTNTMVKNCKEYQEYYCSSTVVVID